MEPIDTLPGVYELEQRWKLGQLEVQAIGGLVYGIGLSVVIERTPFYYGLFAIRLMLLCLFLDVTFFWGEDPLEDSNATQ
jgi:hypothetical protein